MRYLLAIDQGTTGSTALLLNSKLEVLGRHNQEFPQIYPQPGWVEHDPEAIIHSVQGAIQGALERAGISAEEIAGIGITNQRETTLLWDRQDGTPLYNAIVWQCRRTAARCLALKEQGHEPLFRARTGLLLDPYFSGTKLAWLLDELKGARSKAEAGKLCFGTIDSFLVWRLTGGGAHVTEVSNASRTLMMNLQELSWDPELLEILDIPEAILPEIRDSSEIYGQTQGFPGLPDGIPIAGMAGDQQAALFGQVCFEPGEAKCTYGTGSFLLLNTGSQVISSQNGLLSTVAWKRGDEICYALEGSAFVAGAAVQWLRDGLKIIQSAPEVEALARQVPDSGGVYFVPALTGLGAPHWRPEARGLISGLSRGSSAAHLARATLEGIAFQNHDILRAMERDLGQPLRGLRVDGGAAANDLLMQFQSDLLGVELLRPTLLETTALGAAFLAGLALGIWSDREEIRRVWKEERCFKPQMPEEELKQRLEGWEAAVQRS